MNLLLGAVVVGQQQPGGILPAFAGARSSPDVAFDAFGQVVDESIGRRQRRGGSRRRYGWFC
jgi:hypothetical protein